MDLLKSMIIGAAIGAAVLWGYEMTAGQGCASDTTGGIIPGALVGASVQFVLRVTGVS